MVMLPPICDVLVTVTDVAAAMLAVVLKALLAVMLPSAALPPATPFN